MKRACHLALAASAFAALGQADIHVTNCNDSGPGSLRAAILTANTTPGADDIVFDLFCPLILLTTDLPALTDAGTRILGDTAPDALAGPDVVLRGAGAVNGISIIGATGCTVVGLRLENFPGWGIGLQGAAANNQIGGVLSRQEIVSTGNFTGLHLSGFGTEGNTARNGEYYGNSGPGILLGGGASMNVIGAFVANGPNAIHGNGTHGIHLEGVGGPVVANVIEGNYIGTDHGGAAVLGNAVDGVLLEGTTCIANELRMNRILHSGAYGVNVSASQNVVGPLNVISGNSLDGVQIGPGSAITLTQVHNNWIGLDHTGFTALPNLRHGISLRDGTSMNTVEDNLISGNTLSGVQMIGNAPNNNLVQGNMIGLNLAGTGTVPNGAHGIQLANASPLNSLIGNVIAGNLGHGILLGCGATTNTVQGNSIGLLADGATPAGNGLDGIRIQGEDNLVGGANPGEGNVICGSGGWGVSTAGTICNAELFIALENRIEGNRIGLTQGGTPAGNSLGGVLLGNAAIDNRVGADASIPGGGNTIRHNGGPGVQVGVVAPTLVPVENEILTNSIAGNAGLGIRLLGGGNDDLAAPTISAASSTQVDGVNTLFGCGGNTLVQVFYSLGNQGDVFVGETLVSSVEPTWTVTGTIPTGMQVTATNTSTCPGRPSAQTSAFSLPHNLGLGVPYCFGDGSGTACPCANTGGSGEGCANGTGAGASLSASGSASVAADDLVLQGAQLAPGQPGLYFQGNMQTAGGMGLHHGDGLRCAGVAVRRIQIRTANPSGMSSTTVSVATAGAVSVGETKYYQLWYRNPGTSPCGHNFNLSNGLGITWTP